MKVIKTPFLTKAEILEKNIRAINDYVNFMYAQPRESNADNNAYITIGKICVEVLNTIRERKTWVLIFMDRI